MKLCGMACCESTKHVVYIIGQKQHKDAFIKNVFGLSKEQEAYSEFEAKYDGYDLVVQLCDLDTQPNELHELHSSFSCMVVYLTVEDKPVTFGNYTLFVLMGKQSKMMTEDQLTITSVVNDSYDECKRGFSSILQAIKNH